MTTTALNQLTIFGEFGGSYGDPVVIDNAWKDRLAGTAYVGADPMEGFVVALTLEGPTIVGSTEINPDGTWEIINIDSRYADRDLIVLGVPRLTTTNIAIASRQRTVY